VIESISIACDQIVDHDRLVLRVLADVRQVKVAAGTVEYLVRQEDTANV
jgi:hypothetical protein